MHKLENPLRVAELSPAGTLKRLGLAPGKRFLDVGAGTGLFAFEAAKISAETVYAVEVSPEMLRYLGDRAQREGSGNVRVVAGVENVPDGESDLALLCTVLHELRQPGEVLKHIRRALTPSGRLAVIEFHGRRTPMGPPETVRIGEEQAERLLTDAGFRVEGAYSLGENFYCLTALPLSR